MNSSKSFDAYLDRYAKLIPLLGGVIYILGTIVVSIRLSNYGVPTIKLFDINYFVAGTPITIVFATTWISYRLGRKWKVKEKNLIWLAILNAIFLFAAIYYLVLFKDIKRYTPYSIVGIFIGFHLLVVLSTGYSANYYKEKIPGRPASYLDMSVIISLLALFLFLTVRVYEMLPQALGGGRLEELYLFVDKDKCPQVLLDDNWQFNDGMAKTTKLYLIHKTDGEYIVTTSYNNPSKEVLENHLFSTTLTSYYNSFLNGDSKAQ